MGVVGVAIALVFSLVLTANTRPPTSMPLVPAGGFLAPSGHREFLSDAMGDTQIMETSHVPGAVAFSDPAPSFQRVLSLFNADVITSTYWIVETSESPTGLTQELLSVGGEGLTIHAVHSQESGWTLDPGIVELPFSAEPGSDWSSIAIATNDSGESVEWARQAHIEASELENCVDVFIADTLGDEDTDEYRITRCPGRGVVRVGDRTPTDLTRGIDDLDLRTPTPVVPDGDPIDVAAMIGIVSMSIGVTTAPVALGDGLLFPNRTNGHLTFLDPGPDGLWPVIWRRRPGDRVLALLGAGQLAVAATTDNTLVAYDDKGAWRWQSDLTDVVSHLVRVDDDHFAALSLDGWLSVRSLADGEERWGARVASGGEPTPQVLSTGQGLVIAVASGRTLDLVSSGGEVLTVTLPSQVRSLASTGAVVIAADTEANLVAVNPEGRQLWRVGTSDICKAVAVLEDKVVCQTASSLVAVSLDHQKVAWEKPLVSLGVFAAGDRLLVTGNNFTWRLDGSGAVVAHWARERVSASHWAVPLTSGLLVIGADGDCDWWSRR